MHALATASCAPCRGAEAKLSEAELTSALADLPAWTRVGDVISRQFRFKNFLEALAFTNRLGALAEAEGHHPDLTLGWGYVGVSYTTHDAGGLSRNDLIMAAKTDAL